jgi:POT family proton-dependent oligopeptide transporter
MILPTLSMGVFTFVALSKEMTPVLRALNWGALICVAVWYLLILGMSLLRKTDMPDVFWLGARARHNEKEISSARSVGPILFVFALIPIFWALFDQTFSTWVLQGEKMTTFKIGNWVIGPEEMLSANPLLVMILVPIMTWGLYPLLGRLATPLRRMAAGMFLASLSYVVVAMLQQRLEAGQQMSILWQTAPYIVLTIAEVLVSTTGLEFAFREAATEMKSTIMGFWNLTVTMGNLMVVGFTKALAQGESDSVSTGRFLMYAGLTLVVAVLFSVVATRYQYRDAAAAQGK